MEDFVLLSIAYTSGTLCRLVGLLNTGTTTAQYILDSIRTMVKYSDDSIEKSGQTLDAKLDFRIKQCRGQRNFYITGMSLFLML